MTPNAPELTQRWPAPREIPVDLRRGKRRDSILRILDVLVSTQVKLAVLIHRDEPPENRIDEYKTTLTVSERTTVATDNDVVSLELRAPDGSDLERWYPGAHLDLYLPRDGYVSTRCAAIPPIDAATGSRYAGFLMVAADRTRCTTSCQSVPSSAFAVHATHSGSSNPGESSARSAFTSWRVASASHRYCRWSARRSAWAWIGR